MDYISSLVSLASFRQALCHFSRLSRANRPAWKKIYTMKLLRDPFRAEGDRSHVLLREERLPTISSRNSHSLRILRCFGNDLAHGLACYWESAILENLSRHCSTTTVSPVLSFVSSSSSFSSKGDQLRVTCASAGRTRSWPRVMDSRGASDCTWSRISCRRHRRPRQPTTVTARAAAARSSSVPKGRSLGPPGRPSDGRRTTPAGPSAPRRTCRRSRSPHRRWLQSKISRFLWKFLIAYL